MTYRSLFFVVSCEVQAQICRIFLDGYGILDVRIVFFRFLHLSSKMHWIGNVTISRVYYVEGLGHNLFSIGQFCDSNLELKFEKDHLCSACAMGKSKKKPHKPKSEDTNQEKLYLLHMDLCGPMRVASVNGKKYILAIVDDYSQFTWVNCLRSKDETLDFIIKFLKMIQKTGISHETSVSRSPQQDGVIERPRTWASYNQKRYLVFSLAMHPQRNHFKFTTDIPNESLKDIHEIFDEMTVMDSEHSRLGPTLHEITLTTISSGLVPNPPPSTPFVPPFKNDWDLLFQPLFDELLTPPPSVDHPAPEVIAPIAEVVAPEPAASTGSPFSKMLIKIAPSPNIAHMNNDPFFGILIPKNDSKASSSDVIPTIVHTATPNSEPD
ncbi:retrovirus-related pol polyprotein from transposon TNT 1-94 [Tanacetum coccineum]